MVVGPVRRQAMAAASQAYAAASDGRNLIADLADGFGVKMRPRKGFSKWLTKVLVSFAQYLAAVIGAKIAAVVPGITVPPAELNLEWMEGQDIPVDIIIDPRIDA